MKKRTKIIIIVIIIIGVIAGGVFFMNSKKKKEVEKGSSIRTEKVKKDKIISKIDTTGIVNVENSEEIYVSNPLVVEEVFFEQGDLVKKGDVIIKYKDEDKKDLEKNIKKRRLDLENQELELKMLKLDKPDLEDLEDKKEEIDRKENSITQLEITIENLEIQEDQKKEDLATSQKDLEEKRELKEVGSISEDELEEAKKSVDRLKQDLEVHRRNLKKERLNLEQMKKDKEYLKQRYEKEVQDHSDVDLKRYIYQVEKLENSIKGTKLDIESYEDELDKMVSQTISPVTGTIVEMDVDKNYTVNPENPLLKISDITNLIIDVDVSEYDAPKLEIGQKVKITATSLDNKVYSGRVGKISSLSQIKQTSNYEESVVEVEVNFEDEENLLKPGYSVDVEIITQEKEDANVISMLSVLRDDDNKNYVYIMDDQGKPKKEYIETGIRSDLSVEVKNLEVDEEVVLNPTADMDKSPNEENGSGFGPGRGRRR